MGAIMDWLDSIWQAVKVRFQRKAAADVPEGEALQRQMDAEAAELARKAGEGR